ncbi:hypothetical protein BKA69DRAFT_1038477 [Paraphysoderma sedebokerense]|nr:hypothetical protein BKA69DRAFT_1038477 [Paraphysoderma sedebokerense]
MCAESSLMYEFESLKRSCRVEHRLARDPLFDYLIEVVRDMSEEGYPRPPILLQAVCPSAQSLLSILVSRIPALPSIPPRHFIVRHSDSADYKSFIQKLFVVIYEWDIPLIPLTIRKEAQGSQLDVNLLSSQVSVGNTSSQSEIVNRVISKFVNPQFLGKNLLSFGYRRGLKSQTSRIGDEMMEYLLSKTSMFVALPNGCSFQLCGPPTTSKTIIRNVVPKSLWRRRKEIVSNKVKNIDDMSGSPGGTTDPHSEVDQTTSARARKRKSKRTRPGRRKKTTVQATTEAEWQESIQAVTLCVQGRKRQRDMSDDVDMQSKRMKTSTDVIHPTGCKRKQEIFHEFSSVKRVKTGEDAKCDDRNSENAASMRAVNPSVALRKVSQRTKAFPLSLILFHRRRTLYGDAQKNPKSGGLINGLPARWGIPQASVEIEKHSNEHPIDGSGTSQVKLQITYRSELSIAVIFTLAFLGGMKSNIISDHTSPQLHQPEPNQSGMQARSPNIIQKEATETEEERSHLSNYLPFQLLSGLPICVFVRSQCGTIIHVGH